MKKAISIILSLILVLAITLPAAAISSIAVQSFKLNSSKITVKSGQTFSLKATFTPANTTQKTLTYVSANTNIAKVDKNGRLVGANPGTTSVTVMSTADNKILAKCTVIVLRSAKVALKGEIKIDGSSTVFPITEAVAEEFYKIYPEVKIPVGVAGTGGGMKKFVVGEIDICDASRPISASEIASAKSKGIDYVEFQVAKDGITVVVNKENTWVKSITTADLKKIWEPGSKIKKWKEVNPAWPDAEIKLYGPGMDSGTMEFFTEAINGKKLDIRKDYTPSEDDNVLVQGIAGDKNAMGFFGYAYYVENKDTLNELAIDAGKGPITPTYDTIKELTYQPLSRPLFIYVNKKALEKDYVKEFVDFYLTEGTKIVKEVGYVVLDDYSKEIAKLK